MQKNEQSLRDLGDTVKCTNICIIGMERILEEIMLQNFLNLMKTINIHT